MFIDFDLVKKAVSIEETAKMLGLAIKPSNGHQYRGACPACKTGGDRAIVITPSKSAFYCFSEKKGGDQIALAAHVLGCSVKDAAQELANRAGLTNTVPSTRKSTVSTVPESETGQEGTKTFAPLSYLESAHPAVEAIGFDTGFAAKHGIGYAGKGILRGTVAIPFRDEQGNLLGYIGIEDAKLPASFTPNVVDFKKTA